MFIVTFYSYKGGVGRTLALVNVAYGLASKGKRVFILDFDLEAPGLDAFADFGGGPREGIVEYISNFRIEGKVEPLERYVSEVDPVKTAPGKIFFMTAGRKDENYQFLLSALDWKSFYEKQKGFVFVENLKGAIEKMYNPDYVLVDSRTGLTDIAGICTLQLPHLVVLLFNLNNQNVMGVSKIHNSIRSNKLNKEIKTLRVASPIPDTPDLASVRADRENYAKDALGEKIDLILPFDPFVAFEETVLKRDSIRTYLLESYDKLCGLIIKSNRVDVLTMLEDAKKDFDHGNLEAAELTYDEIVQTYPMNPQALAAQGRFLRARGKKKQAVESFKKAVALSPDDPEVLSDLVTANVSAGHMEEAVSYLEPFLASCTNSERLGAVASSLQEGNAPEAAIRVYEKALEVSDDPNYHVEVGNTLMSVGKTTVAVTHYGSVVKRMPSNLIAVYNYGYALNLLGAQEAKEYFSRAIALFEQQDAGRSSPIDAANHYQAISHAYRGIGELGKARQALNKALELARKLALTRPIFSSIQYKRIPAVQFIEETMTLLRKIDQSEAR